MTEKTLILTKKNVKVDSKIKKRYTEFREKYWERYTTNPINSTTKH